ncbi:MAG: DUF2911 domain-containing protein [Gemmatimonadetes bacterium]|nr:DUF2911 domain-containing protein [Gemmatimonadota bacterium]
MKRLLSLTLLLAACNDPRPPERYGFVAVLGRDTVSVERVERSSARLVTDGVDRFPFVRRRHSEFDLDADGKITHMVMDVRTPNARMPAERGRRITADMTRDMVRISIRDSAGVRDTSFRTGGAITVPHVSMMYSVIELEIAAALKRAAALGTATGERVEFRQFYPDRDVGPSFALHRGWVYPRGNGTVELRHDWLSGSGDVTVDSAGRMLTYSGKRSTYQVAVTRTALLPDVESIGDRFVAAELRTGRAQLSVRDTTRATIGAATFAVDYSRPLARGRRLIGDVIPFEFVWRTGANAATQFTTSAPITLAGLSVPAGTYTLWTVPRASRVDLVVNTQAGQWGTEYDKRRDLGRTTLRTDTVADTVEKFTIGITPIDAKRGTLSLSWGTFRWTAPIVVQ